MNGPGTPGVLVGTDPALRALERTYRQTGGDLDRQAWITALLTRDLIEGSDLQFLPAPAGFVNQHHQRKHGVDTWFHVKRYVKFTVELVSPGLWRTVHASNLTMVPIHKVRPVLLRGEYTMGVSPEFFVAYVRDWRPSRIVIPRE